MNTAIRPEIPADHHAVWNVNCAAFETADEAKLVSALREGRYMALSLVAEVGGKIVGHILFSRLAIMTSVGTAEALSLAPMAVLPDYQRQGVGTELVEAGLEACRAKGHKIVVVLGHPEFYPRFGFSAELARPLECAFGSGDAWMAMELVPGSLVGVQGRVEYPPPFGMLEQVALCVDRGSKVLVLSSSQREAIELHHLQGYRLNDIGTRMKRTNGAVAALIYRGTMRLRELLNNERNEFNG